MFRKINTIISAIGLAVLALLLASCGDGSIRPASSSLALAPTPAAIVALAQIPTASGPQDQATNAPANPGDIPDVSQQRVVLKNATLSMTVDDPAKSVTDITQLAEQMGGWVVNSNSNVTERDGHKFVQATISVRVPAVQFSSALEQIKAQAFSVDTENITGDDVTQKYVDLSSQLSNLESTESQLQKIMSTTTNINDVLTVQQKLTDVQGQIEGIKGQLKYFSEAAAFSLINVTLTQKAFPQTPAPTPTITPTPTPRPLGLAGWHPEEIAQNAADTVVSGGQIVISILIWLMITGVPVAIPALILYYIYRRFRPRPASRQNAD